MSAKGLLRELAKGKGGKNDTRLVGTGQKGKREGVSSRGPACTGGGKGKVDLKSVV